MIERIGQILVLIEHRESPGDKEIGNPLPGNGNTHNSRTDRIRENLCQQYPTDRPPRHRETSRVHQHANQRADTDGVRIESRPQDHHRNGHDQCPDNHKRTASEPVDRKDSQYGKREVHSSYHDLLQQSGIGGGPHCLKYLRRIIQHDIDPDKLLETGQKDTDKYDQYTERTNRKDQRHKKTTDQSDLQSTRITSQFQRSVQKQKQHQPHPHK